MRQHRDTFFSTVMRFFNRDVVSFDRDVLQMVNRFIVPQKPTKRSAPELPASRLHKQARTGSVVYSDDEDAPQLRARAQDHSRSSSTARSEVSPLPRTSSRTHSLYLQRI